MRDAAVTEILEVHDNVRTPIRHAVECAHRLSISADGASAFDERTLMARFAAMPGKEGIRAIYVAPGSSLTHCEFLRYFANVTALTLASTRLSSTSGMRFAPQLSDLIIGTGETNRIDLAELPGSSVSRVRIERPRYEDLQTIGQCPHVRRLEVVGSATVDFRLFKRMQLEALALVNVRNEDVRSLDTIDRVDRLSLSQCASLTRFAGTSTRATKLWVDACNQLDLESLGLLRGLRTLRVTKCRQPFDIAVLSRLPEIEEVSFEGCKLLLDDVEQIRAPTLRKFWAGRVKDDVVNRISRACPSAMVCNGTVLERDGVRQDVQAFYEH